MKSPNLTMTLSFIRKLGLVLPISLVGMVAIIIPPDQLNFHPVTRASVANQDPNQAEEYRKLAAAKRKQAEQEPQKRDCYLAWARYYDCLADRAEAGDNRQCPPRPPDC